LLDDVHHPLDATERHYMILIREEETLLKLTKISKGSTNQI